MLRGYAPKNYEGFEPEFDDGYVTALGLSVANGIERAGNLTMLYAQTLKKGYKYLKKVNASYEAENAPEFVKKDIPKNLEELYEQEYEEYKAVVEKRKENHLKLEHMVDVIGDYHKLGSVGRLTTSFVATMVESLNPVEMTVDYLSGGIAGKLVGTASKTTGILGKALSRNSTRTLMEVGITGALGGSFDGATRMYLTNDYNLENFFKSSAYGSMSAIGFYGLGRFRKSFGKIKTEEELKAVGKVLRGDVDVDPKVRKKADKFVRAMREFKDELTPNSNYEQVMDTVDKIIDTHFLIGKKITKEDVLEMLNLPKHSNEFDAAQRLLSIGDNAVKLNDYEINRALQIQIAKEMNDIMTDPNIEAGFKTLGKKRLELDELSKKKRLGKRQRERFVKTAEEVSNLENNLQIKKLNELQKQLDELKIEHGKIREDINSVLDNYDVDSFLSERGNYNEEFMTVNVDNIARKLGEDVEHQSIRTGEYDGVEDPKIKAETVENEVNAGKVNTDDVQLRENVTDFIDIERKWKDNDDIVDLVRQFSEQGCKL